MQDRSSKRPGDLNQLAKLIVGIATGDCEDPILTADGKNAAAVALGLCGGLKGCVDRAQSLTVDQRKQIAQKAAQVRWKRTKDD